MAGKMQGGEETPSVDSPKLLRGYWYHNANVKHQQWLCQSDHDCSRSDEDDFADFPHSSESSFVIHRLGQRSDFIPMVNSLLHSKLRSLIASDGLPITHCLELNYRD